VKEYVEQPVNRPLRLLIYPGADGSYALYEDDGKSFDYRKGTWMKVEMSWRDRDRRLSLRLAAGARMLPPARRAMTVRVAGSQIEKTIVFEGRPLEVRL
jgi:hypothetical protein